MEGERARFFIRTSDRSLASPTSSARRRFRRGHNRCKPTPALARNEHDKKGARCELDHTGGHMARPYWVAASLEQRAQVLEQRAEVLQRLLRIGLHILFRKLETGGIFCQGLPDGGLAPQVKREVYRIHIYDQRDQEADDQRQIL